jgi:hypothetical protein
MLWFSIFSLCNFFSQIHVQIDGGESYWYHTTRDTHGVHAALQVPDTDKLHIPPGPGPEPGLDPKLFSKKTSQLDVRDHRGLEYGKWRPANQVLFF